MTDEQKAAIKALVKAFKLAKSAKLCFMGMDSELLAYDEQELLEAGYADGDPLEAMREAEYVTVNTHGAYKDSGGW